MTRAPAGMATFEPDAVDGVVRHDDDAVRDRRAAVAVDEARRFDGDDGVGGERSVGEEEEREEFAHSRDSIFVGADALVRPRGVSRAIARLGGRGRPPPHGSTSVPSAPHIPTADE